LVGKNLAHYEVLEKIGAGGMGEVYRARDTRLGRDVALKILPEAFLEDPERLARFAREAQLLAALSHTCIAQVYGLEQDQGQRFLVMELVPGEDVADRLGRGKLPMDEAVSVARQIAEALEAAHEAGIVHRDLKPHNIRLTPDGAVKVLDFGLAKALEGDPAAGSSANLSQSPTLTGMLTSANVILGTAAYMSPEQARGKPVDRRADIWAFGCVLYEMLTGKQAFHGETVSDTLAAVLKTEPERDALPGDTPAGLRRLLDRCLDKEARTRLRDIGEARILLSGDLDEAPVAAGEPAPSRRPSVATMVGALVFVVVAFLLGKGLQSEVAMSTLYADLEAPPEAPFYSEPQVADIALSPDGNQLAFAAEDSAGNASLWVRNLNSPAAYELTGTGGAYLPFWSPDGRYVGFFSGGKLRRIEARGGAPLALCDAPGGRGGTWSDDGTILAALSAAGPLFRVTASGGEFSPVTRIEGETLGDRSHRWPHALPGGDLFLYSTLSRTQSVFVGSLSDTSLRVELPGVHGNPAYHDGRIFFVREGVLMSQGFDLKKLELVGEAAVVTSLNVPFHPGWRRAAYTFGGGNLVYFSDVGVDEGYGIAEYDKAGNRAVWHDMGGSVDDITLSPNGRRLAMELTPSGSGAGDVWTYDTVRKMRTRVTFTERADDPVWGPDNHRLVFASGGDLYLKDADGSEEPELLHTDGLDHVPSGFSRDGRYVLYVTGGGGSEELYLYDMENREARKILGGDYRYVHGQISPDGKWLAYATDETGELEVFVQDFPGLKRRWQMSSASGSMPRWLGDSRALVYLDEGMTLHEVDLLVDGEDLEVGEDRELFTTGVDGFSIRTHQYAMTDDGERFFSMEAREGARRESVPLKLVVNWQPE
jgi:serine/threonine protein kinase